MGEGRSGKEEPSGFKVSDKRHFTSDGDIIDQEQVEEEPPRAEAPAAEPAPEEPKQAETQAPPSGQPAGEEPPPGQGEKVDFTHLVMSLAHTASFSFVMPQIFVFIIPEAPSSSPRYLLPLKALPPQAPRLFYSSSST